MQWKHRRKKSSAVNLMGPEDKLANLDWETPSQDRRWENGEEQGSRERRTGKEEGGEQLGEEGGRLKSYFYWAAISADYSRSVGAPLPAEASLKWQAARGGEGRHAMIISRLSVGHWYGYSMSINLHQRDYCHSCHVLCPTGRKALLSLDSFYFMIFIMVQLRGFSLETLENNNNNVCYSSEQLASFRFLSWWRKSCLCFVG